MSNPNGQVSILGTAGLRLDRRPGTRGSQVDPELIKLYDWKRPDKFSKEQINTVRILHETFARQSVASLSAKLHSIVQVRLASVDQLNYGEFTQSIPAICMMAIFGMDPLKGSALLEIDHKLVFAMVDRLFGGRGESAAIEREVTDIEYFVMEGLITRLLDNLREAWAPVLDLKPHLCQIEEMPQFAQIVPPSEMIVLVTLEVKVGDATGFMNLCLPYITIEPIVPLLSAQALYGLKVNQVEGPDRQGLVSSVETEVEVSYEGGKRSLAELASLKPGSLVELPGYASGCAQLWSGGSVIARLVAKRGREVSKRGRGAARTRYEIVEGRGAAEWLSRGRGEKAQAAELDERLARALEPLVRELSESRKGLEEKIAGGLASISRKQDEMADQLSFAPAGDGIPQSSGAAEGAERVRPFDWIKRVDNAMIADFLHIELPQLIALVLSQLEPQKAAVILGMLPPETQVAVARKIALMEQSSPETLGMVEQVLRKKLAAISTGGAIPAGGVDSIVEILGLADRSTEANVVRSLDKDDPALAEEIKKRMFVFEDIVLIDPKSIAKVMTRVDPELLLRALKATSNEVRELIWGCVPGKDRDGLKKRFEEIGSVRLGEADAAQQKIVALIAEMEGSGEIVIPRPGETVV